MGKIVVTGGLGFIGSHTVVELLEKSYDVVVIDNLSNSSIDVKKGIEKITGKSFELKVLELTNKNEVFNFFSEEKDIDGIIHFAAYKAVGESVQNPLMYYENNLYSLINLLKACKEFDLKSNFIFSSSCTVYGNDNSLPIDENSHTPPAASPYGNTKQICEEILKDTSKVEENLHIISLRYFNPIGAHPSTKIGELPLGRPQNLVPFITQTAAGVLEQLTVFGDNYNTTDGTCIRDYIDVVDLAKAHVAALELLEKGNKSKKYDVFNLGTGKGTTVLEVIEAFENVSGEKLNYQIGPRRSGDVEAIYADTQKANTVLGWKAQTSLEESILNAWKWEQKIRAHQKVEVAIS